jgi:hypothetical protein
MSHDNENTVNSSPNPTYKLPVTVVAVRSRFEPPRPKEIEELFPAIRVTDVLCELFLPNRWKDPISVQLFPTGEQFEQLKYVFKFSLAYDDGALRIDAPVVDWKDGGMHQWPSGVRDYSIEGKAAEITVTRSGNHSRFPNTVFTITPNVLLKPWKMLIPDLSGEVFLRSQQRFAFPIAKWGWTVFDFHYYSQVTSAGRLTYPELVAECDIPLGKTVDEVASSLDDFLLVVSFASRQRVACLGWSWAGPEEHISRYRGNVTMPRQLPNHSFNDTLIFDHDFADFMRRCWPVFETHRQKPLLRQALQRLVFYRDRNATLTETFYLGLYATIEAVVQLFVAEHPDKATVVPRVEWRLLQDALKETVRANVVDRTHRAAMNPALNALNRASVGAVLSTFCEHFRIALSDLWPIAESPEGITLSQLRNKLIHGYFLGPQFDRSLWIARIHLEWIAERLLLALLGWPVREPTRVTGMVLEGTFGEIYKRSNWLRAREELSAAG